MLVAVRDRRIRGKIAERIEGLQTNPELQGKALTGELNGYRSLRAVGQRYRIVYKVEKQQVIVLVVGIGLRKEGDRHDIYELAQKLVRLGLTRR